MKNMFKDCESLEILNLNFNTDNVENMENMFSLCLNLSSLNITTFNIDNCNSFTNMLENDEGLILYVDTFKCKKLVETIPDYVIIIDVVTIPSIGEINSIYDIQNSDKKTQLLGKEFKFNIDYRLDIYINGKKIKFSKEYKVNDIGETNIKFKLYYDLNMDYMFKDVSDLISIEMISENNCKILSMNSTFENAKALNQFYISGFSGEEIKSMNKLFYNTDLNYYSFNSFDSRNLEDISYMFSNTDINEFSLNGLMINNVKNMSHLFDNCLSLVSFNNEGFDTRNVIDMSNMFSSCISLSEIDVSNFKTQKVENMAGMFEDCENLNIVWI